MPKQREEHVKVKAGGPRREEEEEEGRPLSRPLLNDALLRETELDLTFLGVKMDEEQKDGFVWKKIE